MQEVISLLRICALCTILSIGYAINCKSILEAIINGQLSSDIWSIIYVASSTVLFVLCALVIFMTLCGIKIKLLSTGIGKFAISSLFVIGSCGYIGSILLVLLVFDTNNTNQYINWQYELFYAILPLYLSVLIFFFNNKRFTQVLNLTLFSFILLIPPCIQFSLQHFSFNATIFPNNNIINIKSASQVTIFEISAYLSICVATSILILIQIICMLKHYNSGLFLKFLIILLLAYGVIVLITEQIDFNIYSDKYRIYYYYILLTLLCIIYSCEIFVPGKKKLVEIDASDIMRRKSFDIDIERQMMINGNIQIKGILQRFKAEEKEIDVFLEADESRISVSGVSSNIVDLPNPNKHIDSVIKIFADFKPTKENSNAYFSEFEVEPTYLNANKPTIDRKTDSIAVIVPFYNEKACEIHATLRALHQNFEFIKKKDKKYKFTHFNVLLVGDGWFKAHISTKKYLTELYPNVFNNINENDNDLEYFNNFKEQNHKHNTVILQTKHNKKLCINPFKNNEKNIFLKLTTIIKIDNRKKANSHEWFLGKYGFAEYCQCEYMFFTDAYSTMKPESLYRMVQHMNDPVNDDVVCCTGRARVYTIEQELELQNLLREEETKYDCEEINYKWWDNNIFKCDNEIKVDLFNDNSNEEEEDDVFYNIQDTEFDHRLTTNAHLRDCQMFEFEALYGTIGCYLLGGFLAVIPGPCGFYRSKYLLSDQVRGWYFEKINQTNDPNDMDLVLGNMKLAEDRILTVTSILNSDKSVRHSLIPECVFYFDPMQNMTQLMKQRRRWLNGSIATVIFILRKISFSKWNVNIFRKYYVLSMWYMQLFMYFVVSLSPPLLFIISFKYGLAILLTKIVKGDSAKENMVDGITTALVVISWLIYLIFIYFMQRGSDFKWKWIEIKKEGIVQMTLIFSFMFGIFTLIGVLMQILNIFYPKELPESIENDVVTKTFNYIIITLSLIFFCQSFILAPLVSKDFNTFKILCKTFMNYYLYSPFYVTFFFINAIANIHDLSWGTRPDNEAEKDTNPKRTTIKVLLIVIFIDIIIALSVSTLSSYKWSHIIFFTLLAFPSLYMIFFSLLWLAKPRCGEIWRACKPKRMKENIEYVGLRDL